MLGSGTPADPFIIRNVVDLQNINLNLAAHYALGNDIDASATSGWNNGLGFNPIGGTLGFTGELDGRGHRIINLFINRPTTDFVGLFSILRSWSTVINVHLRGGSITGRDNVGGLVGETRHNAGVYNSSATVTVSGHMYVGGFVGSVDQCRAIEHCFGAGDVSAENVVGGFVGVVGWGTITSCYATGAVSGHTCVGGFVGNNAGFPI